MATRRQKTPVQAALYMRPNWLPSVTYTLPDLLFGGFCGLGCCVFFFYISAS
jgi:hypothetical protein